MRCSSCGFENAEGLKFCNECGAAFKRRCTQCGFENAPLAKFCGECGVALAAKEPEKQVKGEERLASRVQSLGSEEKEQAAVVQTIGPRPRDPRRDTAERRQLTVMFCDLVDSTTLSALLDPEELREVVHGYHEACAGVISRYAGHTAQHLGDGLLVYFGYPAAHEDDAQRAVRTGLEILANLQSLNAHLSPTIRARLPHPIQVRIGVHTGPVVIGEIGGGEKREILALGETPNLAARIQGQASPDAVLISAVTYRLIEGLFECEDCGQPELKGVTTPLTLYRVMKESEAHSRFEVVTRKGLTPLVGRDHEANLLMDRWTQVKEGQGQVVLVSGEAGIGKSRLAQLLKERVANEAQVQVECRCSPYFQNSALYPVITHLQKFLHFGQEEAAHSKLQKLERMLRSYQIALSEAVPLLTALLSLPHPDGYPALAFSPQKQRQRTLETLLAWLLKETDRQPVGMVWEDLHWADPTSLEFVSLLIEQAPTTRLLLLATFRPEFQPPWSRRSHITQLTLNRLSPRQAETMMENVTGGRMLPAEVVRQILLKTDGVPLFVEELTKTVLESVESIGAIESVASVGAHGHAPLQLGIPPTLQDALMARLDRLGPAKEIAQLGATLGREFDYALLHAISPLREDVLQQGLQRLVAAELLFQRGLPPHVAYIFKHALIQDTAYQSLLKSKRQHLHQQVAHILEGQFSDLKETQPELLAHHYTEAGLTEQAIPYWQRAGERASQSSAYAEAVVHFTKGLELLKILPDAPERVREELMLQMALSVPLMVTKGYAAPEVEQTFSRARDLCRQGEETPQLFSMLLGLSSFYMVRAELKTARELAEQCLRLAQRAHSSRRLIWAHNQLGQILSFQGEIALAQGHMMQGITLYDSQKHSPLVSGTTQDPGVSCLCFASRVLWLLGYPDQALARIQEALTLAQKLSHPFSLAYAFRFATALHQYRREQQPTQEWAERTMALATEQGFPFWSALGTILQGWALIEQGKIGEGMAQIPQGLTAYRATGSEYAQSSYLALLAEAYRKGGRVKEGLTLLAEALTFVDKTGERYWEAELYRLKGQLTLQSQVESHKSKVEEAEACFLKAIEIARRQQAKSLELRAGMSLSQLWRQQGKKEEARQLLAEIYSWFTEGFDTKDLQEAKALLEALREGNT